jgi:SPP1 family predicted phage head-tail adaptor
MKSKVIFKIGDLRHVVQFQENNSTQQDRTGQPIANWETFQTIKAAIRPISGREYFVAHQTQADVTHRLECRYFTPKPTPTQRIVWTDEVSLLTRKLEIVSVLDIEERHFKYEFLCKELVNQPAEDT